MAGFGRCRSQWVKKYNSESKQSEITLFEQSGEKSQRTAVTTVILRQIYAIRTQIAFRFYILFFHEQVCFGLVKTFC